MRLTVNALLDPVVNFGKVTVSTGYGSIDTVIVLKAGDGSKLPEGSFNLVWYNGSTYPDPSDDPNVEIVRCTSRDGDVLTLERHQEGTVASTKNELGRVYNMTLSPTKKTIDDIKSEYTSGVSTHSALSTDVHGVGLDTVDGVDARNTAISTHSSIASSVHGFDASGNAPAQSHDNTRHSETYATQSAVSTQLGLKADLASPAFTGVVTAPTIEATTGLKLPVGTNMWVT